MMIEKTLRERLLEIDGMESGGISQEDRLALRLILQQDRKRARRMKWAVAAAWTVFLLGLMGGGWIESSGERFPDYWVSTASMLVGSFFLIAIVMTLSCGVRVWTARNRELQTYMMSMEARLSSLEERIS